MTLLNEKMIVGSGSQKSPQLFLKGGKEAGR